MDFAKIANDVNFNKPKTIEVEFVENINGTFNSIFRSVDNHNKYYMREDDQ